MKIKAISAQTDQGPFLQVNEDAYDFDLENNLYMVLDGFGGAGIGDVSVSALKENMKKFYTNIASDPDSTLPFFFSPKYLVEGNALINAMLYSHNILVKENMQKETARRGGASGIFLSKAESILTLASVGNCVAFLYRKGIFRRIFIEDSFKFLNQHCQKQIKKDN